MCACGSSCVLWLTAMAVQYDKDLCQEFFDAYKDCRKRMVRHCMHVWCNDVLMGCVWRVCRSRTGLCSGSSAMRHRSWRVTVPSRSPASDVM